ncbi:hypothetical protein T484DRAFT_1664088, partial [Baffinella frigidus]
MKLTAFRLLYCDRVGGAYFSGYDTESCWKHMPNITAPSTGVNVAPDGEQLVRYKKDGKGKVSESKGHVEVRRGTSEYELAHSPPLLATGISIQVLSTDTPNNDAVLTEIEVFTEPPCSWTDGCSAFELNIIEEEEKQRRARLRKLIKEIKDERAVEDFKVAEVTAKTGSLLKRAEELLAQAETQFKLSNFKGQYGCFGLLEQGREAFVEAGLLENRAKELDHLGEKYRLAGAADEARRRGEEEAAAKLKVQV